MLRHRQSRFSSDSALKSLAAIQQNLLEQRLKNNSMKVYSA